MYPDAHPSQNIQSSPDVYEVENQAADPEHRIEAAIWERAPWNGKVVLDLGAGTGYHVERFHAQAAEVIAVEPHEPSRRRAEARVSALGLSRARVLAGSAEHIPLPRASVDLVHARFAYFWGPGSEPGLREVQRVVRSGGAVFIIDNQLDSGTFASWLRRSCWSADVDGAAVAHYWREHGFEHARIESEWRFARAEDLDAVIRLEFPPDLADQILATHTDLVVDYHYALYFRRY